jgi:hypothetical protein
MFVEPGSHGINAEKSQIGFYLNKKIRPYTRLRIAMDKRRITEIEEKYAEGHQKSLIHLPVFCPEQIDNEKHEKKQGEKLIRIVKLEHHSDKIIQQNTKG